MAPKKNANAVKKTAEKSREKDNIEEDEQRKQLRNKGYSISIRKVLKQVYPDTVGISPKALIMMNNIVNGCFEFIATEASRLAENKGRSKITVRGIQSAIRLLLPGELVNQSIGEGNKAIQKYIDSIADEEDFSVTLLTRYSIVQCDLEEEAQEYGDLAQGLPTQNVYQSVKISANEDDLYNFDTTRYISAGATHSECLPIRKNLNK